MQLAIVVGHTERSPGRVTSYAREYTLNEELAHAISNRCNAVGISNVVIYRENGYEKLPANINQYNTDYCICVHHNGFDDPEVNGTETLYYHKSETSKKLARYINSGMVNALGYKNRDIKPIDSEGRGGYVLKYTKMPCVLIEPYFMTNKEAVKNRDNVKLAKFIVDGFIQFLEA